MNLLQSIRTCINNSYSALLTDDKSSAMRTDVNLAAACHLSVFTEDKIYCSSSFAVVFSCRMMIISMAANTTTPAAKIAHNKYGGRSDCDCSAAGVTGSSRLKLASGNLSS